MMNLNGPPLRPPLRKPQAEYDRTRMERNRKIGIGVAAHAAKVRTTLTRHANSVPTEANPDFNPEREPGFRSAYERNVGSRQ